MLKHGDIWKAIDALAARHGLSPSGLAKRAGLDPTTFNPSKRITPQGKPRWPSTESIAKILHATSANMAEFVGLLPEQSVGAHQRIPLIGYAQAGARGFFDDGGFPVGGGWDEVLFPDLGDPNAYALEISGESMLPVFRDGDVIIVSPAAGIRRGDRVVLRTQEDEVMAKELARMSANRIELLSLNPDYPGRTFARDEVVWMSRIVWASQ